MSENRLFVQCKPELGGRVECRHGSIYVTAKPGEILEVCSKQFAVAMSSGYFDQVDNPEALLEPDPEPAPVATKSRRRK